MLSWFYLLLAAIAETIFSIQSYHSRGFTVLWPSVYASVAGIGAAVFLALAMKQLPIGLAVVIWSGSSTVAAAIYGIVVLHEARDLPRLSFMLLILVGMTGLKLTSPS